MRSHTRRTMIGLLAGVALALGSAGCGDDADGSASGTDSLGDTGSASSTVPWTEAEGTRVGAGGGEIAIDAGGGWTSTAAASEASASEDGSAGAPGAPGREPDARPLITLEIPPGALDEEVDIRVSWRRLAEDDPLRPDGYWVGTPLFQFSPEGLTFNEPIAVRIRSSVSRSPSESPSSLFWSLPGDRGSFAALEDTSWSEGYMVGQVTHFSRAFVGALCTPSCSNRECGGDGCGGICGTCEEGTICRLGLCEEPMEGADGDSSSWPVTSDTADWASTSTAAQPEYTPSEPISTTEKPTE